MCLYVSKTSVCAPFTRLSACKEFLLWERKNAAQLFRKRVRYCFEQITDHIPFGNVVIYWGGGVAVEVFLLKYLQLSIKVHISRVVGRAAFRVSSEKRLGDKFSKLLAQIFRRFPESRLYFLTDDSLISFSNNVPASPFVFHSALELSPIFGNHNTSSIAFRAIHFRDTYPNYLFSFIPTTVPAAIMIHSSSSQTLPAIEVSTILCRYTSSVPSYIASRLMCTVEMQDEKRSQSPVDVIRKSRARLSMSN